MKVPCPFLPSPLHIALFPISLLLTLQLWADPSVGIISGMLWLLPLLGRDAPDVTCSAASSSSSSDHVLSCRLPREPLKLPMPRLSARNLDRKVTNDRLLLRCFSQRAVRTCRSSSACSSSRQALSTERNSWGTLCTSGSISDTRLRNLKEWDNNNKWQLIR